jgi:hypothetical protein
MAFGENENLSSVGDLMKSLTFSGVALFLLLVFGGTFAWIMFQRQAEAFAFITTSPSLMYGFAVCVLLGMLGFVFSGLVKYIDRQRDLVTKQMDSKYETAVNLLTNQINGLQAQVLAVETRERECQTQRIEDANKLHAMHQDMNNMITQLVQSGVIDRRVKTGGEL